MKNEIETAIKALLLKITSNVLADDACKYTQAALNAAHVLAVLDTNDRQNKQQ